MLYSSAASYNPLMLPQEITDITLGDISGAVVVSGGSKPKNSVEPSDAMIRVWKEGGANVEPSTKMLALIGFIRDWETTGDKIICFSQCECPSNFK